MEADQLAEECETSGLNQEAFCRENRIHAVALTLTVIRRQRHPRLGWTALMYLCDRDLRDLIPKLCITSEEGIDAFDPDGQIQPASVDLRLSSVFWKPLKRRTLDLRRAKLLEVQPRRYYRRTDLQPGDTIVIKPGELRLLAV